MGKKRHPGNMGFVIAVTMLLIVFAIGPGSLQGMAQGRNTVTGIVFDSNRNPVPNIRVELLDEVETRIAYVQTDGSGRYVFSNLSDGNFLLRVVTIGTNYVTQPVRVQLFPAGGRGAHHEQVDLRLREAKKDGSPSMINPGLAFAQDVPEDAQKAFDRAIEVFSTGKDTQTGIAYLNDAVGIFPTYYLALERLGLEYVKLAQFQQAMDILTRALKVNDKGHASLYAMGVAQYRMKEYPKAIESLHKMLSLAPGSPNAAYSHYFLGLALLRDGNSAEAELSLKKATEYGSGHVPSDVHMALAQIYSNTKRFKMAADELEHYLKETPDATNAENLRTLINQLRAKK